MNEGAVAREPGVERPGDVDQEGSSQALAARARAALPTLVPSDKRVIEAVLADPARVLSQSVTDLAEAADTAASTVVRACRQLGYRGFHDLKLGIARDLGRADRDQLSHPQGIDSSTPPEQLVERILRFSSATLLDCVETVDAGALHESVEQLAAARRILVVGAGTSAAPAQDAAYRLSVLGLMVDGPSNAVAADVVAAQLDDSCVCLAISHTGTTRETLTPTDTAAQTGAFVVAITSFVRSPLTRLADVSLIAGGAEQGFRLEAMASRLAHLAVVDALFVGLAVSDQARFGEALERMAAVTADHSL
jgi:RpiR family transcriptional regulator, carbohydrate utilization regulator